MRIFIYLGLSVIIGSYVLKWYMGSKPSANDNLTPEQRTEIQNEYIKKAKETAELQKIQTAAQLLIIDHVESAIQPIKYDMSVLMSNSSESKVANEKLIEIERNRPTEPVATPMPSPTPVDLLALGTGGTAAPSVPTPTSSPSPSPTPSPTPTPTPARARVEYSENVVKLFLRNGAGVLVRFNQKLSLAERSRFGYSLVGQCLTDSEQPPICGKSISIPADFRTRVHSCEGQEVKKVGIGCAKGEDCWSGDEQSLIVAPLANLSFIVGRIEAVEFDKIACAEAEGQQ